MNIIETLAKLAKERVEASKQLIPYDEMKYMALSMPDDTFDHEVALSRKGLSFIAECKKAMPVVGIVSEGTHFLETAAELEIAGACCLSVVTEPQWFLGCRDHLRLIAGEVSIPCLRKETLVDDYMIYESKVIGAKGVMLITSILTDEQLRSFIGVCDSLGISAFVEADSESEIKRALAAGARIITVNNRNITDYTLDMERSIRLREFVPHDVVYVAEGGVSTVEYVHRLRETGADAVIVGEALMRARSRADKLTELRTRRS